MAGMSISFGGVVFLSLESKIAGALFFTVGLFMVCSFGFHLYTGKVCYVFDNNREYMMELPVIWLGNLAGTLLVGGLVRMTRISGISEKASAMCAVKTGDGLLSLFILGFLCDIFIYLAVEGYKSITNDVGRYLAIFFGVMVFILCGYEHCVADMFYFSVAGAWNGKAVLAILVITAGNSAGGVFLPLLRRAAAAKNR